LVLDQQGLPVIAYVDEAAPSVLIMMFCNDVSCVGGDELISTIDSYGRVWAPSLAIDPSGAPVIAYQDLSGGGLVLVRCNDAWCSGADESIVTVDPAGWHPSLALDGSGFPVIAYYDGTTGGLTSAQGGLKVVRCNDPGCAGGDESIAHVDVDGQVGWFPSLALDADELPVIAYYDFGDPNQANGHLRLVHCNDRACLGADETPVVLDPSRDSGRHPSLVLDRAGNPAISFTDTTANASLKLLRCDDPGCLGDEEAAVALDGAASLSWFTQLSLTEQDTPVIVYTKDAEQLRLLRCNDPSCSGGDELFVALGPAAMIQLPRDPSALLDADGWSVIAAAGPGGDLWLIHCGDALCQSGPWPDQPVATPTTVPPTGSPGLPPTGSTRSRSALGLGVALVASSIGGLLVAISRMRRSAQP
jgi:hypothetical protein